MESFLAWIFSALKPVDTDDILKLSSGCRYLLLIVLCMFLSKTFVYSNIYKHNGFERSQLYIRI